jgi:hypothetical protein
MKNKIKINWVCSDGVSFEKEKDAEKYQNLLNKFEESKHFLDYAKIDSEFTKIIGKVLLSKDHQAGINTHVKLENWQALYRQDIRNSTDALFLNHFNSEVRFVVSNLIQTLISETKNSK